jgi:cysteine desulfuration protein SufE
MRTFRRALRPSGRYLAMIFDAVNGEPPATVLAIPQDFVRQVMDRIGLGTREVGLNAMIERLKRAARQAQADEAGPAGESA